MDDHIWSASFGDRPSLAIEDEQRSLILGTLILFSVNILQGEHSSLVYDGLLVPETLSQRRILLIDMLNLVFIMVTLKNETHLRVLTIRLLVIATKNK